MENSRFTKTILMIGIAFASIPLLILMLYLVLSFIIYINKLRQGFGLTIFIVLMFIIMICTTGILITTIK
jgi:hypothetical protein